MKAASSPGGTCLHEKNEHQLPRDLQKERGNETTQGMERSVDRGRERASWLSPYLVLCLDKNIRKKGSLHLLLAPHSSRFSTTLSRSFFPFSAGLRARVFSPRPPPRCTLSLSLSLCFFVLF